MPKTPAIPSFALFGEVHREDPAGFGHIETIAARSSLHDWEISPHRHDRGVQVLIVLDGNARVTMDGKGFDLPGPGFVAIPVGCVHGFQFAPGTTGHVLTLSQDFAGRANGPDDPLGLRLARGGHGALPVEAAERIRWLAEEMPTLAQDWRHGERLFLALAEALVRSLPSPDRPETVDENDRRLALFRHLVETHLREHRPLEFYAHSTGTTVRTLNRLCRRRLGCTPLELINRRATLEAQRLLRYTNATISQVAAELGFADPSYFSRFYLRMTGRRPQAERQTALS